MEKLSQSCHRKQSKESKGERENNIHREKKEVVKLLIDKTLSLAYREYTLVFMKGAIYWQESNPKL